MADFIIRHLRQGDIDALVADIREADRDEVTAATGRALRDTIDDCVAASAWCLAMEFPTGGLGCLYGLAPMGGFLGRSAAPWLLGTKALERNPRALIRLGPAYLEHMLASYPHLYNYVDARNTRSIRWLKWLGFTFHDAKPYGAAGLPFHRFEMRS